MCTHIQCRNQQVNRRHIKITYFFTAPESARGYVIYEKKFGNRPSIFEAIYFEADV